MQFYPSWNSYQPTNAAGSSLFNPLTGLGGMIQGTQIGRSPTGTGYVPSGFAPQNLPGSQLFNPITGQGGAIQGNQFTRGTNLSAYAAKPQAAPAAGGYSGFPAYTQHAPQQASQQAPAAAPTQQAGPSQALLSSPIGRFLQYNPGGASAMQNSPSFKYLLGQLMQGVGG